jgi:hypothetical protein
MWDSLQFTAAPTIDVILSEAPTARSRRTRTNKVRALFALRSKLYLPEPRYI